MIKISERDVALLGVNTITFFTGIMFVILLPVVKLAGYMSENSYPLHEGGIYILYTMSTWIMLVIGIITVCIDIWWMYLQFVEEKKAWL